MSGMNCESCMYYTYDEDYECYVCDMDLDEDEMIRFLRGDSGGCAHYQYADEYSCLLYTSPSPRDSTSSRMPSSA